MWLLIAAMEGVVTSGGEAPASVEPSWSHAVSIDTASAPSIPKVAAEPLLSRPPAAQSLGGDSVSVGQRLDPPAKSVGVPATTVTLAAEKPTGFQSPAATASGVDSAGDMQPASTLACSVQSSPSPPVHNDVVLTPSSDRQPSSTSTSARAPTSSLASTPTSTASCNMPLMMPAEPPHDAAVTRDAGPPKAKQAPARVRGLATPTPTLSRSKQNRMQSVKLDVDANSLDLPLTSSVTPTASSSTVQSDVTTPRSVAADQLNAGSDDPAAATLSSLVASPKTPGSSPGSYLRSHLQRRVGGAAAMYADGCTSPAPGSFHAMHERKSRSMSPTSQTDSYRSSTTTSTVRSSTAHDSHAHSTAEQEMSSVDWAARSLSPYRSAGTCSARHVTEYKHCVTLDEDDEARMSRRSAENTHAKLFGVETPDSPRTAAVASAAAAGGLKAAQHQKTAENTYATLFGPPDAHRRSSRLYPDTHLRMFGPPPSATDPQRRSRCPSSCDTPDLLHHDAAAADRTDHRRDAVKTRYALRHQDTSAKLFGDADTPMHQSPATATPTARPYRDHDIFLVGQQQQQQQSSVSASSSVTSSTVTADSP